MLINIDGELGNGSLPKILYYIHRQIGTAVARGMSLSTQALAVRSLSMEARMTICIMSIEAGARRGDDRAGMRPLFNYVKAGILLLKVRIGTRLLLTGRPCQ